MKKFVQDEYVRPVWGLGPIYRVVTQFSCGTVWAYEPILPGQANRICEAVPLWPFHLVKVPDPWERR